MGRLMKSRQNLSARLIQNNTKLVPVLGSDEWPPLGYLFYQKEFSFLSVSQNLKLTQNF